MKLSYDRETDMLHISFGQRVEVEGFDLCDGVVIHLDAEENVAGIEIENASEQIDLGYLRAMAHAGQASTDARGRGTDVLRPRC